VERENFIVRRGQMLTLGKNVSDGLYLAYCPLLAFLLEGADVPHITIKLLRK
jgi:hypothetical protein